MPINSKSKGKRNELAFAHWLRESGLDINARRGVQYKGTPDSPDIDTDLPIHFEVKAVERFNLWQAMDQAVADCGSDIPVVAYKKSRKPWLLVVRADEFRDLCHQIELSVPYRA